MDVLRRAAIRKLSDHSPKPGRRPDGNLPVSGYPLNRGSFSADFSRRVGTESLDIKPERFGRYVLLDRVGVGGMAEVFRAVMPGAQGFQRTFVVKRILGERAQSPYFVDMFVREARINAVLHHPNIVQVFDFGEVGGTYFLAMEYVRGRDVSAIARRLRHRARPCPVGVAAFIAHEVAQALGYAHALTSPEGTPLNVVHRDVSPSNIICQRAGGVKLLDFGIAQALTEPEAEKTQRMFKGKIAYVAPERIKDQPADSRSDLFSLGVVLWELLAGRKLFRGKTEVETLQNVVEMPVPALSSHPRGRAGRAGTDRRARAGPRSRPSATRRRTSWPRISRRCWPPCATSRGRCRRCCASCSGPSCRRARFRRPALTPELLAGPGRRPARRRRRQHAAPGAERRRRERRRGARAVAMAVVGRLRPSRPPRCWCCCSGAAAAGARWPRRYGRGPACHRPRPPRPGAHSPPSVPRRPPRRNPTRPRPRRASRRRPNRARRARSAGQGRIVARAFDQPVRRGRVAGGIDDAGHALAHCRRRRAVRGAAPGRSRNAHRGRHRSAEALRRRRGRLQGRALRRGAGEVSGRLRRQAAAGVPGQHRAVPAAAGRPQSGARDLPRIRPGGARLASGPRGAGVDRAAGRRDRRSGRWRKRGGRRRRRQR